MQIAGACVVEFFAILVANDNARVHIGTEAGVGELKAEVGLVVVHEEILIHEHTRLERASGEEHQRALDGAGGQRAAVGGKMVGPGGSSAPEGEPGAVRCRHCLSEMAELDCPDDSGVWMRFSGLDQLADGVLRNLDVVVANDHIVETLGQALTKRCVVPAAVSEVVGRYANVEFGNARAMRIVEDPWPQPTSATRAPRSSFSTTPSSAGSQLSTRFAA